MWSLTEEKCFSRERKGHPSLTEGDLGERGMLGFKDSLEISSVSQETSRKSSQPQIRLHQTSVYREELEAIDTNPTRHSSLGIQGHEQLLLSEVSYN